MNCNLAEASICVWGAIGASVECCLVFRGEVHIAVLLANWFSNSKKLVRRVYQATQHFLCAGQNSLIFKSQCHFCSFRKVRSGSQQRAKSWVMPVCNPKGNVVEVFDRFVEIFRRLVINGSRLSPTEKTLGGLAICISKHDFSNSSCHFKRRIHKVIAIDTSSVIHRDFKCDKCRTERGNCSCPACGGWAGQKLAEITDVGACEKKSEEGQQVARNPRTPRHVTGCQAPPHRAFFSHAGFSLLCLCAGNVTESMRGRP